MRSLITQILQDIRYAIRLLARNPSYADHNERVRGELISGNFFEVLGVRPWAGRLFTQEDDRTPGTHPVAVISYDFWERRFAKHPNITAIAPDTVAESLRAD